jgi:CheY-like chemotaxis protein
MSDRAKVLVAEDYKPLVELYNVWLKDQYEVIAAYNGQEAVDKFREHRPDLVIMDVRMPVKGGDEAIKEIFQMEPGARIVAITAYPYTEEELGVEVVRKGFKKDEFLKLVERKLKE